MNGIAYEEVPLVISSHDGMEMMDSDTWDEDRFLFDHRRRKRRWACISGLNGACTRCLSSLSRCCFRKKPPQPRVLTLGRPTDRKYPGNAVKNNKYNIITFIPIVLFDQFRFFLNFVFLMMACSQFIPQIRIGFIYTYWGPLSFVIAVTMCREAFDDICRYYRDKVVNRSKYLLHTESGWKATCSENLKVGDIIQIHKDERVPADCILLQTTEKSGSCFVRTDQLDGETDWKLRVAVADTQELETVDGIGELNAEIHAEPPHKDIHKFEGTYQRDPPRGEPEIREPLTLEATLWANAVVASGTAVAVVLHTGKDTRAVMNASKPRAKVGKLDLELNNLVKILFAVVLLLSFTMVLMKGFAGPWYLNFFRFVLLFSYIIPLSLRVNLDMAKLVYAVLIGKDDQIPGTVVRSSTIPEELGRIGYLMTDKTGTLTMNSMVMKRIHLGNVSFAFDTFDEIRANLRSSYSGVAKSPSFSRHSVIFKVQQAVEAIALCHNVTPITTSGTSSRPSSPKSNGTPPQEEAHPVADGLGSDDEDVLFEQKVSYQASSPDEVALVAWTEEVGLTLVYRDRTHMTLRTPDGDLLQFEILQLFPFSSQTKRMGIIVKEVESGAITLYMKGADTVMRDMVQYNDWLDEECTNLAREGLRTLVVARKTLTLQQYEEFEVQYKAASTALTDRNARTTAVLSRLEQDLQLLCLTGVEDQLQYEVRTTLELLQNAGIRVWMLTGDKLETAICIAKSSRLVQRTHTLHVVRDVSSRAEVQAELNALARKSNVALVITGDALKMCMESYFEEFAMLACTCSAVVCCRVSPEQKSAIVRMLTRHQPAKRIAAVGDGGNDVGMILAAHAGIGIVGKEGQQASMAADFSITQFSHLQRLLLLHGRYTYKRSCAMGQFVIHRGLIVSVMQAIFSCIFYFVSVSLYQGLLMVAYSTFFTAFPVFSLVMDRDVKETVCLQYPELYRELEKGRSLSYKTFFIWFLASMYSGGVIMYGAMLLFEQDLLHLVSITFTALVLTELLMVALTVHTWHWSMVVAETFSILLYMLCVFFVRQYFDVDFVRTPQFLWKTLLITLVSCLPLYIFKFVQRRWAPPSYAKLS